jgi:hypothetical protein
MDRTLGFFGQTQHSARVSQKDFPGRADSQSTPVAKKQVHAQLCFQRLDTGGDIRRYAMQHLSGASNAAGIRNGLEHTNLGKFHSSPKVNG